MVVRPGHLLRAERFGDGVGDLGTEAQVVYRVGESVRLAFGRVEVVVQIMHVHCAVAETATWRQVEIPYDFVHPESAFDSTPLLALRVELLAVVLPLALLHVFAFSKSPADAGVGFAHFFAGGAAALF